MRVIDQGVDAERWVLSESARVNDGTMIGQDSEPRRPTILVVERDPTTMEMLVEAIRHRFDAQLTATRCAEDALDADRLTPHDLVVASVNLEGMNGLTLTQQLMRRHRRPVILTTLRLSAEQAIEALRVRAVDLLVKPFDLAVLLRRMELELADRQELGRHQQRSSRVRQLVRNVLRERRALRERLDFVCRDLVGAHQRLLNHVLADRDDPHT